MLNNHDPLDELLSMSLDEVMKQVKYAYDFYIEEEKCEPEVAKIMAIQEFQLWFYGDKEKENNLRKLVNDL